jgi:hypothetical protein
MIGEGSRQCWRPIRGVGVDWSGLGRVVLECERVGGSWEDIWLYVQDTVLAIRRELMNKGGAERHLPLLGRSAVILRNLLLACSGAGAECHPLDPWISSPRMVVAMHLHLRDSFHSPPCSPLAHQVHALSTMQHGATNNRSGMRTAGRRWWRRGCKGVC